MDNTEQTLYGIPLSDLKGTEYEGGTYYQAPGYCFYVPDDVEDSTPAFIYYPGSGGSGNDAKYIREMIANNSLQQIVVIPNASNQRNADVNYYGLINNIGESNNANITNISTMGFSAGGPSTYNQLLYNAKTNPDGGPYNTVFCDVVGFWPKEEDLAAIAATGSTVMFLEPSWSNSTSSQSNKMAKAGINVIVATATGNHGAHVPLNSEALQNGIIDYISGVSNELANSDIYTFNKYNAETGTWEVITIDQLAELYEFSIFDTSDPLRYYEKLSSIEPLESSNSFLGDKINNLRTAIRNTNFLSSNIGVDYASTTNIPGVESDIVQSFFTSTSMLLNLLEKDTSKIIDIGNSIEDMNAELEVQANELNDPNNIVVDNKNNNQTTTDVYTDTNTSTNNNTNTNIVVPPVVDNTPSNNGNNGTNNSTNNGTSAPVVQPNNGNNGGNSGVVIDETNAVIATLVTSISKQVLDLEEKVEDKIDKDIKYDNETTINKELIDKFLKYDELYSDDKMLVFDGEDGKYKIVIHHEEGKVVGLEYYYDLGDKTTATKALELMKEDFSDLESVKQEGQYVKLTFKDDLYKDLSLDGLKEVYKDFDEIKKPEVE